MNELAADKTLAVILFNGITEKLDCFYKSIGTSVYRLHFDTGEEFSVTYITPNIYIRYEGMLLGNVSSSKCSLQDTGEDDDTLASRIVEALLAVSQVFMGGSEFVVKPEILEDGTPIMVTHLNITEATISKLYVLHDILRDGLTDMNNL